MYKYIILDFGNVLVKSPTNDWDMTSKFLELIDINKLNIDKFNKLLKQNRHIMDEKITTMEEEYDMFTRFYNNVLSNVDYKNYDIEISKQIAYDRTYNMNKYDVFENVIDELTKLKEKYKLLLLTDNWPCVIMYLKEHKLYNFFDKIYISSFYGYLKREKVLFDYPIKDYNIKKGEALFIDDLEENLDAAQEKGLDVLLMDRFKTIKKSKYKIINDLSNI